VDAEVRETIRRRVPDLIGRGDKPGRRFPQPAREDFLTGREPTVGLGRFETVHLILAVGNLRHEPAAARTEVFVSVQQDVRIFVANPLEERAILFSQRLATPARHNGCRHRVAHQRRHGLRERGDLSFEDRSDVMQHDAERSRKVELWNAAAHRTPQIRFESAPKRGEI